MPFRANSTKKKGSWKTMEWFYVRISSLDSKVRSLADTCMYVYHSVTSSSRLPLVALHWFTRCCSQLSHQQKSYRYAFTPVAGLDQDSHSGRKARTVIQTRYNHSFQIPFNYFVPSWNSYLHKNHCIRAKFSSRTRMKVLPVSYKHPVDPPFTANYHSG